MQQLTDEHKTYTATLRLGQTTASYDAETDVEQERPWAHVDESSIREVLKDFTGPLQQFPPDFSAKRFQGERAYFLARKGETVDLPARPIVIHALDLIVWEGADVTVEVRCRKGTYIRSLAHDIGQALGCGAHLVGLRRTANGAFHVKDARTPEEWSQWFDRWESGRHANPDS